MITRVVSGLYGGKRSGSFAGKTASAESGHPVGILTRVVSGLYGGKRNGSFADKTPEVSSGHPVGLITRTVSGLYGGRRSGSFAGKALATTGGQRSGGGRALMGWDGKTYSSPEDLDRISQKRIYFDESRARITEQVKEFKSEIQQGISEQSLTIAAETIDDIKAEINKLKAGRDELTGIEYEFYFLQYQIEIEFMTELIEEIDVAFITFMMIGE